MDDAYLHNSSLAAMLRAGSYTLTSRYYVLHALNRRLLASLTMEDVRLRLWSSQYCILSNTLVNYLSFLKLL